MAEQKFSEDKEWLGANECLVAETGESLVTASVSVVDFSFTMLKVKVGLMLANTWVTSLESLALKTCNTGCNTAVNGALSALRALTSTISNLNTQTAGTSTETQGTGASGNALSLGQVPMGLHT